MRSAGNRGVVQSRLQVLHVHVFLVAPLGARHMAEPGADQHQSGVAIEEKSAVEYIPCDLADAEWKTLLRGAGFKAEDKSFGSLLGLSYYLDSDSFRGLLRSISDLWSDGSAMCFDYQTPDGSGETRWNEQLAGAAGESMKAKYTAAEIEKMLADSGFLIYEQLDDEEMTKRYFAPCRDDMRAPKGVNYILAVKKR